MQPATVPFGHQSWGEAMVERVMWMSSQNLRSVEIQLDPAELGPLRFISRTAVRNCRFSSSARTPACGKR